MPERRRRYGGSVRDPSAVRFAARPGRTRSWLRWRRRGHRRGRGLRIVVATLLLLGLAIDTLADQRFKTHARIGMRDAPARGDGLVFVAGLDRKEFIPQQPRRRDGGDRIHRQLDRRVHADGEGGEEGLGIERLRDDGADLDAADLDVAAVAQAVDLVELRGERIAAHRMYLGGGVGEE